MTERGKTGPGGNRPFAVKKQATPPWILVTFIGVPSLVIVVLAGFLVKNLVTGDPEPPPEPPSTRTLEREAEQLLLQGLNFKKEGKQLSDKGDERAYARFKMALGKLADAQKKYQTIIDEIKREEGVETLPEEYRGYEERMTVIQRHKLDVARMMGMGLKRR